MQPWPAPPVQREETDRATEGTDPRGRKGGRVGKCGEATRHRRG